MEHYTKGKNVEEPLEKECIPINNLPDKFLWMRVNPGTKVRNVLSFALKTFKDEKCVVWSGSGPAVEKTISCVEIMKRRHKSLHQITKICFRRVEEYWEPKEEGLDQLVVTREIPTIHILLSREPLDQNEPGYQAPGCKDSFWKPEEISDKPKHAKPPRGEHQRNQSGPKNKKMKQNKQSPSPKQPQQNVNKNE